MVFDASSSWTKYAINVIQERMDMRKVTAKNIVFSNAFISCHVTIVIPPHAHMR